ncbi:hypothetical protein KC851_02140 [Candidatus Kaiserbacteria bacterium]|nr:hypothetical protein [Candidatus Kaiserbacteria bacterium]
MTEPEIQLLSKKRRNLLFISLVIIFLVSLPAMIFYTTGYRLNFSNEERTIVTTGGIYITTDNLDVDVYIDERREEGRRLFRQAYYLQNIEAGLHRVVVQGEGLQTWVKELPVDPHIVIEAAAFNMPVTPQLRPITEYTIEGVPVYLGVSTTSGLFTNVSTTVPVLATSSKRVNTAYNVNEEYLYVDSLFSSSSTSSLSVFELLLEEVDRFRFATTSDQLVSTSSEAIIERGGIRLVEKDNDLYAVWNTEAGTIPYYFCVPVDASASTSARYGQHVADAYALLEQATSTRIIFDSDRACRPEIKLNRLAQDIFFYDFFPDSSDLILLKLEDGLYVTEIDDRAWQNTQLLYGGTDFRVVVENNLIYIEKDGYYFELLTELSGN